MVFSLKRVAGMILILPFSLTINVTGSPQVQIRRPVSGLVSAWAGLMSSANNIREFLNMLIFKFIPKY